MAGKSEKKRKKHDRLRRQNDAHLKKLAAEKRFRGAIQRVLDALGMPDLFRQMPAFQQTFLIQCRMRTVRIDLAEGVKIPRRTLDFLRSILSTILSTHKVQVIPGCGSITMEDYFTAGFALGFLGRPDENERDESVINIQRKLEPLWKITDELKTNHILDLLNLLEEYFLLFNRINQKMHYLMPSMYSAKIDRVSVSLELNQSNVEVKEFVINGKPRHAYRIGLVKCSVGRIWISLSGCDFGLNCVISDLPMKVYIQSHALIRLRQRLDSFPHYILHALILNAILEKDITYSGKNLALAAVMLANVKLGYFQMEIVGGDVIVKTFLFVTNTGTPEGDRLDKELHIGKFEKQFVEIDKLSTFVQSDLMQDERVRAVFIKAGLGYLCDLDPKLFGTRDSIKQGYAADFIKYLHPGVSDPWEKSVSPHDGN